jgi:hypothetical protein
MPRVLGSRNWLPACIAALVSMSALPTQASILSDDGGMIHVLGPSAAPQLTEAFQRAGPTWHLESAQIDRTEVKGQACLGEGTARCFNYRLSFPDDACDAMRTGPWCLEVENAQAIPKELAVLSDALSKVPAQVWSLAAPPPKEVPSEATAPASGGPAVLSTIIRTLLYFVLPLFAGALLGLLVRRLLRAWWVRAAGATAFVAGALAAFGKVPLGVWDLGLLGLLAAAGFLGATGAKGRFRWRGPVFGGFVLLLGCLLLELLVRRVVPEPPRFPPATSARLWFQPEDIEDACRAMELERQPPWLNWRSGGEIRSDERVLHLGDSMVQGEGVEGNETFAAALERLDPGVAHINAGAAGSSVDAYLMVLRTWIDRAKPTRVVVHLFTGNDLDEIDQPYSCCEAQSFFTYPNGQPQQRCTTPRRKFSTFTLLRQAPAPYPVRVLTGLSWSARHAANAFKLFSFRLSVRYKPPPPPPDVAYAHIEAVLQALRDDLRARNLPLTAVVLPFRGALQSEHPKDSREWHIAQRFLAIARRLDVPVLDAWDYFEHLTREEGGSRLFVTPPDWDVHFSAEGHLRYAKWLLGELGPGLRRAPETRAAAQP